MTGENVYVFSCGNSGRAGLTLQPDGANLPTLLECPRPWSFVAKIPLTEEHLSRLTLETTLALSNLLARGYHIARPLGLELPHPHHSST